MKKHIAILILVSFVTSCNTSPSYDDPPKMVPDHTPYIAGLIEASPDTTHHYPEVVVGYFTDNYIGQKDWVSLGILTEYPGIYSPPLLRQLVQTSILFGLTWEPEPKAKVSVKGPLGTPKEKVVIFTHEGKGIYGDQNYSLSRVPNGRYKLQVVLPDGRTYQSITQIPEATELILPDSVAIKVVLKPFGDGTPKEEAVPGYPMPVNYPANSFVTVTQTNASIDRELFLLDPEETFRYNDRSQYLREGSSYKIRFSHSRPDTIYKPWIQTLDKPKDEVWMSFHVWVRFSFYSQGIGKMYFPMFNIFASTKEWDTNMWRPSGNATGHNDSTYLFEVSTIRKIGTDGKVLPKDSSDAIGFFGGYYSLYKQYTMYPIRNFDLDSVLAAND